MKPKLVPCSRCGNDRPVWKRIDNLPYCKSCTVFVVVKASTEGKPRPKPIAPRSEKGKAEDRQYSLLRKPFLIMHDSCQARLPGCTGLSSQVHHKKGRQKYYLDVTTWLAVCHNCHVIIETRPADAKALGLSENRLT